MKMLSFTCNEIQRSNVFADKYIKAGVLTMVLSWGGEDLFDPKSVSYGLTNNLKWSAIYYVAAATFFKIRKMVQNKLNQSEEEREAFYKDIERVDKTLLVGAGLMGLSFYVDENQQWFSLVVAGYITASSWVFSVIFKENTYEDF